MGVWVCDHLVRFCTQSSGVSGSEEQVQSDNVHVNACYAQVGGSGVLIGMHAVRCDEVTETLTDKKTIVDDGMSASELNNEWEFSQFPSVDSVAVVNSDNVDCDVDSTRSRPNVHNRASIAKLSTLQFVNVDVDGVTCKLLVDSGAQITLISHSLFDKIKPDVCGYVNLVGVIGESLRVPLVSVNIKQGGGCNSVNVAEGIQVVCAVAPLNAVDHDVVLPLDVVTDLESMPVVHVMCVTAGSVDINSVAGMNDCDACSSEAVGVNNECLTTNDDVKPIVVHNTDQLMMNDDDHGNEELITAQRGDPSLAHCWEMAQLNKGNFIVDRGILFHVDHVEGERVCQLCVPECKRNSVMQLAHDSVFSGHLAERKTRERIRLSFYWPKLRQYVKQYVATCHDCQLRSRPKTLDRVPITPITRADLPFQVLHMDCVGPINPPPRRVTSIVYVLSITVRGGLQCMH